VDGVSSQREHDRAVALHRMMQAGRVGWGTGQATAGELKQEAWYPCDSQDRLAPVRFQRDTIPMRYGMANLLWNVPSIILVLFPCWLCLLSQVSFCPPLRWPSSSWPMMPRALCSRPSVRLQRSPARHIVCHCTQTCRYPAHTCKGWLTHCS
jgi:hypothetical protein